MQKTSSNQSQTNIDRISFERRANKDVSELCM